MQAIIKLYIYPSEENSDPTFEYTATYPDGTNLYNEHLLLNEQLDEIIREACLSLPGEEYYITATEVMRDLDPKLIAAEVTDDMSKRAARIRKEWDKAQPSSKDSK